MRLLRFVTAWCVCLGSLAVPHAVRSALAFTHVVQKGETLASISEDLYGSVQNERLLVTANHLDSPMATPIAPGMRLEVPAPLHYRVEHGDTWAALALEFLGDGARATTLALANGSSPWLVPEEGAEIVIPYNLRVVAKDGDDIVSLAYAYLGDRTQGWMLDVYNHLKGRRLKRGDVVLVPLTEIALTELGKRSAAEAASQIRSQADADKRKAQGDVTAELPALLADVRGGRYVDAIQRGLGLLANQELSTPQRGAIQRQLLEAYVALDAPGLATTSCQAWRSADPTAVLDPIRLSPKIVEACKRASGLK